MTRAASLSCSLRKELRALSLPWLACLAAMAASAVYGGGWLRSLGMPTYFVGAVALGALSIGHEYSHRTLTLLLSHPARRGRLVVEKLSVLAVLLLTLYAVASLIMFDASGFRNAGARQSERVAALFLPVLCGLFVAPWLTMLCRSPIAGTVFSIAIPGLLLLLGESLGVAKYGSGSAPEGFRMAVLWRGMLGLCAVGAVMTWRTFMRLEAIEGRGPEVHRPRWLRPMRTIAAAHTLTKRHPVWLLAKKEMRLQQMALAVGGLYLIAWVGVAPLTHLVPDLEDIFTALSVFYSGLVPVLIGSLACAEERQMGTLEWQVLLPMATSKQWAVKVGVALGLAVLLALGLPALLVALTRLLPAGAGLMPLPLGSHLLLALPVIVLTIGGVYVSSLCGSGLRALLMSLPAMLGVGLFVKIVAESLGPAVFTVVSDQRFLIAPPGPGVAETRFTLAVVALLLTAGLLAVVVRFALANYRSADRAPARVLRQVISIAGCLTIGLALLLGVTVFVSLRMG